MSVDGLQKIKIQWNKVVDLMKLFLICKKFIKALLHGHYS